MTKYWVQWSYIYKNYLGDRTYQDELCKESMFVTTEDLESWWIGFCSDNSDLSKIKLTNVVKL